MLYNYKNIAFDGCSQYGLNHIHFCLFDFFTTGEYLYFIATVVHF